MLFPQETVALLAALFLTAACADTGRLPQRKSGESLHPDNQVEDICLSDAESGTPCVGVPESGGSTSKDTVLPITGDGNAVFTLILDAATLALADGEQVAWWPDRGTAGHNASQTIAHLRPTFHTKGLNGRPFVRFDGVDDALETGPFPAPAKQPISLILVFRTAAGTSTAVLGSQSNNVFVGAWSNKDGSRSKYVMYAGHNLDTARKPSGGFELISAIFDGGNSKLYVNGVLEDRENAGDRPFEDLTVGAGAESLDSFKGDIAEIRLYGARLTESIRHAIECELNATYRLALSTCPQKPRGQDPYFLQSGSPTD